jgi:hypothetical protein
MRRLLPVPALARLAVLAALAGRPVAAQAPPSATGGDATAPEGRPGVTAAVDTTATTVGGRIRLTITVDAPEGWLVEPPAAKAELGAFRVRSVEPATGAAGARSFVLNLIAVEAGAQEIPPVSLRARRGAEAPVDLVTPAIPVSVATNLPAAAGDSAEARPADLKPALAAPRDWRPVWIAAIAAAVAFFLAFLALRRLRRRRGKEEPAVAERRTPARPAWEIALEDLDRIAAARLVDRGELRRQYEEVTEALRRYVENRWGLPALECTTYDLRLLLAHVPIRPETSARLLSLLSEADLVKFAKAIPEPASARSAESRAREIVGETIPAETSGEAAA